MSPEPSGLAHYDVEHYALWKECISDRYVSRIIRLAWLSPLVLERLVMHREPTVLTLKDLCGVAELPWDDQPGRVFD